MDDAREPAYAPYTQRLMKSLLATLADMDFVHQHERAKVGRSRTDSGIKDFLLDRLERRHRERREPYIRHLAQLRREHGRTASSGKPAAARTGQLPENRDFAR